MFIRQQARLYPTTEQIQFLNQEIGNQRFVWNSILAKSNERYETEKKFIFYNESVILLSELKETYEFLTIGGSQALQQTLKDQEQSLKNFLKSRKTGGHFGYPKFKKKGNGGSVRYPQGCSLDSKSLKIPKLKTKIKIKNQQNIQEFNSVSIIKKPSGKWFASFVVEIPDVEKVEITTDSKVVGIDLNSKFFVVLDSGQAIENQKFLKKKEKRLKKYQRRMSKMVKCSSNKNKQRIKVARLHEKIANSRKDFVEKITTQVATTYDIICLEDLNVKGMQKWNGRMIQEAPFRMFRDKMTWKANKFGKHLTIINRFDPTSKNCSGCGSLLELTLNDRWIECDCGLSIHRDHNAAKNIKFSGLQYTVGTTGFEACGDTKVHSRDNSVRWVSLKQETNGSLALW